MAAEAFAPAKINLALHVIGRRDDGYHLLDSLVVFADVGDIVTATPAGAWSLTIDGPFSAGLSTTDNLVLRAAMMTGGPSAALTLTKHLPVASGIGGGSADAAATLRALAAMDGRPIPDDVLALGADVPVCLGGQPARMTGVGEHLTALPSLPSLHICLVNPGIAVSTPEVFSALRSRQNAPLPEFPDRMNADGFVRWLTTTRNDLEAPARAVAPQIDTVLDRIGRAPDCLFARMSGSGSTCFGLFADAEQAETAAAQIAADHPDWWVAAASVID